MSTRLYASELQQISDDEISVICGTDGEKRDGYDVVIAGLDTATFMASSPTFMVEHTPPPIGVFTRLGVVSARELGLGIAGDALCGIVRLAPGEISDYVAEKRSLIKAGIYNAVSMGFDPLEFDPRDRQRITRSELLEVSAVSVPADSTARIVARSHRSRPSSMAAIFRSLPAVPERAIERGLAQAGRPPANQRPLGLLGGAALVEAVRQERAQHARTMWAIGQESSYEQRLRDLARLSRDD